MLKSSEQTNRSLHVLAIVTTVFLPATLVTGVFGMYCKLPRRSHASHRREPHPFRPGISLL